MVICGVEEVILVTLGEVEEVGGMEAQAPLTLLSGVVDGLQLTQTEKHVC